VVTLRFPSRRAGIIIVISRVFLFTIIIGERRRSGVVCGERGGVFFFFGGK